MREQTFLLFFYFTARIRFFCMYRENCNMKIKIAPAIPSSSASAISSSSEKKWVFLLHNWKKKGVPNARTGKNFKQTLYDE